MTLELSQYRKSCRTFSKCEPLAVAASDYYRLGNALRLYVSVRPAKVVQEGGPESSAIDFAVKTFDCRLDSEIAFGSDCQMTAFDRQGLERGLKILNLQPDQRVVIVWSVPKSLNKLCGVWILFKFISVEDGKNEASQVAISKLKPLVGIDPQKLWFHRFRHSKPMMS